MTPGRHLRTTLGRTAAAVVVAVVLLIGLASPAQAHAYLERTNPADGSVVDHSPARLSLSFSEHVVLEATVIEVVDGSGRTTRLHDLRLETDAPDDTEEPATITAALPDLPADAYQVRWSTLSSDDLHTTSGFFAFGVRTSVVAAGFQEPAPGIGESGLRWVLLLGYALALGSVLVGRLAPPDLDTRRARRAGTCGAAVAAGAAVLLAADQVLGRDLGLGQLVHSSYLARWSVRETGLLLVLLALTRWARRSRLTDVVLACGAVLAAVGTALVGHAGSDPGAGYTRVVATAVHLLTMLGWTGGVLCLAVLLLPGGVLPDSRQLAVRRLLRRFGTPAAVLLGLGVATGVYLSSHTVGSVDAALRTAYGRTLLVKVTLLSLVLVLALLNHRHVHGRHDLDLPRRGVLLEAGTAVLVLAATGVLTSSQPATEPQLVAQPPATAGPLSADSDDLHLAVDLTPDAPGVNVVSVDVFDTRRPAPGQVTQVWIDVDGTPQRAASLGDGRWTLGGVDLAAGSHEVDVVVVRPGLSDSTTRWSWRLGDDTVLAPLVSNAPIATVVRTSSLVLLLGWAGWLLMTGRRVRRSGRLGPENLTRAGDRPRPRSEPRLPSRSPGP